MIIDIIYSKQAKKFLTRHKNIITVDETDNILRDAVRKLLGKDVNVDVIKMRGKYKGNYRVRKGDIRIIFYIEKGVIHIVNVKKIGFRGGIYKN